MLEAHLKSLYMAPKQSTKEKEKKKKKKKKQHRIR
jgi:hypothetical protein